MDSQLLFFISGLPAAAAYGATLLGKKLAEKALEGVTTSTFQDVGKKIADHIIVGSYIFDMNRLLPFSYSRSKFDRINRSNT